MATPDDVEVEYPMDKALKEMYYNADVPSFSGGVENLFRSAKKAREQKVTYGRVIQFLADQQRYSFHKPARRHFKRKPTFVKGIDAQWQADLAACSL